MKDNIKLKTENINLKGASMKNSSPFIGKNFITQFHGSKLRIWQKITVFLLIEFLLVGQTPFVLAQSQEAPDQPVEQELELPPGAEDIFDEQVDESPFMPVGAPAFDVGSENPFFDSDNDSIPGSDQEDTGYGIEDIISIDDTLRMELADKSQMPRYKVKFNITDATSFVNIGFDEVSLTEKDNGGYIYSEKILSVMTKDGNITVEYTFYRSEDGVDEGGVMEDDAVENYEYGVEYTAEFQVTLSSIRIYVYKTSDGISDDPNFVVEDIDSPVFYATSQDNPSGNLSLEILKKIDAGYEPVDLDNDGDIDAYYDSSTGIWGVDIDGDGIPDGQGIDTDDDGIPDQFRFDQDRDGIADGAATDFNIDYEGGGFVVDVPRTDKTIIRADGTLDIYNSEGELISSLNTQGTSTSYEYLPGGGRRITSVDTEGNVSIQVFDANDRLITQTVKLKIDGVLQEPGERTGFLYENDGDPANPGGEIRSQYTDDNGDGIKDPEEGFITRAIFDSDSNLLSLTSFDSPKEGDLTIQRFQPNGNIGSMTIDESVEHGDGFTIQQFDVNGNIMNATTHNGLTGDEVIQRYDTNGRIVTQTDNDGETHELTLHYFKYETNPSGSYIGWQIREERLHDQYNPNIKSIANIDKNGSLVDTSIFSEDNPSFMETYIQYNVPDNDSTTYHSYEQDGSESKLIYNDLNQMTLQQSLDNEGIVEQSTLYEYETIGAQNFRKGYVDSNKDGVLDPDETLFESIAELDNYGDIMNVTSYDEDGVTPVSVTELNKPEYGWSTYRQLNEPEGKATIQMIDYDSHLRAMMTLDSPWANYEDSDHVEESTVFEYDSGYRWGYLDTNRNGQRDAGEDHIQSVAQFDNDGNFISITTYKEDGTTISSVVEFDWPAEGYSASRILDNDGDTVQITDSDNNLVAMMSLTEKWGDYKNPADIDSSTVFVYSGNYRWGYVDADCDAVKDTTDTLVSSVAELDNDGNILNLTSYKEDGATIYSVTEFNWPAEDYSATRVLDEDGDTVQISDNEGNLAAMMSLYDMWGNYKDSDDVETSVVYVYAGDYRWGYVDEAQNGVYDPEDTKVSSVAQLDTGDNITSITSYDQGGQISSVTEFNWPAEDYTATRILDEDGDMVQISDNEGNLSAMMTLKEMWGDYKNGSEVESSVVYVYAGEYRWGYVDADCDAVKDTTDTLVSSVAQLDNEGNILNVTSYKEDGITISSVTEFNWPAEDYSATRILDEDGDTIQISDNDGNLAAMMTLKETWGDYKNGSEVESSVVYVYAGEYRWGYVDSDCDAVKDASDTLVSSVAQLDGEGNIINVTSYKEDGATISSVTEFNWPAEDYSATRILDEDGDMIQISDNDGNLAAMMTLKETWGDYKNGSEVESSVVYVYAGEYRWGYVDADCDAVKDASDTLVSSVAQLDGEGNIINVTSYKEDGTTISSVTEFNWPAEDYSATRILDEDGDTIQISDNDGNLAAMMTLKDTWGNYKDPNDVESSVVYVYAGDYRWGYIDENKNGVRDGGDNVSLEGFDTLVTGEDPNGISELDWFVFGGEVLDRVVQGSGGNKWIHIDFASPVGQGPNWVTLGLGQKDGSEYVPPLDLTGSTIRFDIRVTGLDAHFSNVISVEIVDGAGNTARLANISLVDMPDESDGWVTLEFSVDDLTYYETGTAPDVTMIEKVQILFLQTQSDIQETGGGVDIDNLRINEPMLQSVAQLDGEGNIINVTSYKEDGATISSVTEFNWPAEDYSATRILDEDGDMIQISDNDGNLAAMMTLKETWGDYKNGTEVESSVVYVYAGEYRWGYVDADCDAVKDASDTLVSSVAQLDGEGNIINVTSYKEDGATISSVTEFNWPAEDYSATRILDEDGDMIQISDNDGNLAAMMTLKETWGDYKNGTEVESSVVYVYAGEYRWGYVDADCDAVKDASDTLVSSVAQLDGEGNIINVTSYKEDGATISSVTEFNWPAEDYSATRILDEDGDMIQISDNDGNLAAMMTLKETWGDYKNGSEVESSVVYVYAGEYRWGYVDADCDAVKDASDTLVSSVAQLDGEGNIINVTSYKEDGATISSVTEFNWPAEDYSATRILDEDGDMIQISDNDGNLAAMMTLKETWGDYKNGSEVESSVVYVYAGEYRWGYVDADCDAVKDASDTLVSSVAQLDGEGNIINVTSYKEDGVTISSVTEFNWPAEDYSATRILDEDGDMIQISDNDGNLAAMMTLKETWGDYKNGSEVESSVVYVYAGEYRWGYVDADCDAIKDASDTLVSSVAQLDGEGNIINVTSYKEDGVTISSVTEFNWPAEDYSATRILDEDGDMIQISDNDGNLAAMMTLKETWGDYKNGSEVESSVVYVYAGEYRWGYVDADCDAIKDASDTLVSSVAQLDGEGNIINVTSYKEDGVTISSVTEFNWPAEDYSATRILDEDGDMIQISDNDGNLAAMMTLKETWGDYKNGSEVESSVVYVYAGEYRWGYVDADCDAIKDASDTLVSSVAQLDGEGNIINVTSYKEDGVTISSVTEFNWPAEDYSATRILDEDGDMIQISDNDGNLAAMMTLKETWGDYKNGSEVESSVVYVYAGEYRWGYVDADCDAIKDASDTLVSSVAQLDGEGNIINVTSYKEDGVTISSVTEFNWPAEDYSATRILDEDGDMIQISDNDGNLAAMMTLKETWGDYKNGSEVESSVVYVYAGEYRWGYVDADCDAIKDASDTLVSSVAQLDGEGNIINVTSYKEDGVTISSVTEFNWPAEDYSATRILDEDGDMIQISDNDGNLAAMMTLKETWGDYKNGSEVESSVVYVYAGEYRWGYVDADCDAIKDASDTLVSSVAQLDGEGNIINVTSYKEDGTTISSVTEFNWPAEDYSATRILDEDGDTIQISDNDGNLAAMMTLKETWGDYKNGSEVESSVVYVYAGEYRWGYVDADCDAVKDASDTLVSSVAQLDGEGNIINVTSYKEDGVTISSVTEFNWPAEDYSATRILDEDGDTIQISDNDGNLAAMMTLKETWGDYKNGSEVESSVVYVYAGEYRWGYVDADCDAVKDASDTLVSSVAQLDGEGNIINVTSYKEDGVTISSVTEFNWPAEDYSATRILDEDGDTIQISDNDGNLAAMMTLKETWGDYKNGSEVESSVVYVYAGEYRWGYVDADCDAVKDASDTLVSSVAQLDGEGNIINVTSYKEDGVTISSVTEFNWPAEDYSATRILDEDGDTIQISDNDGNLAAMMTLKETWGDYKNGSEVESSVVYVYAGEYRWGYIDENKNGVRDGGDNVSLEGFDTLVTGEDPNGISELDWFVFGGEVLDRVVQGSGGNKWIHIDFASPVGQGPNWVTLGLGQKDGSEYVPPLDLTGSTIRFDIRVTDLDAHFSNVISVEIVDGAGNTARLANISLVDMPDESDGWVTLEFSVDDLTHYETGTAPDVTMIEKVQILFLQTQSDIQETGGGVDIDNLRVNEPMLQSVAQLDGEGNIINMTSYKEDGVTISSVTEFNWPAEDYSATRILDEDGDTIQISDNDGNLAAMMTLKETWGDYKNGSEVESSVVYVYAGEYRWGYVDADCDAVKDASDTLVSSVAQLDGEGNIINVTSYKEDGVTISSVTEFNWPAEDYSATRILDEDGDTIQISDNDGNLAAMMTLKETWGDYKNGSEVESSVVYVYAGEYRWGYVDADCDAVKDASDTLVSSVAQLDGEGNIINVTSYKEDGVTISSVTEFNWPAEDYSATRILDEDGDTIQISDNDGNLAAMMTLKETWGDYKNGSEVESSVVYVYAGEYRWGYVDADCDAVKDASDTLVSSVAQLDGEGNIINVTSYKEDGVTISSVTEFNWPAEDYSATRILDEDGDTIQISDNDGNLAAMMTLKDTWGDYKNGSEVESSVVYVYAGDYRWGYVDADCDAVKDASDTLVSSVAQLDGEGNIINVTSYKEDGVTISSVTEFNWPAEDYSATRILDEDGDTIQISDNDGNLAAMMTLKETWGDYKNGSEVESSVVYVYAGEYRWGYVDADCDAVKDASDTLVSSVAQLDGEGNIINVTSYKEDGTTISSVTEFNWPAEDYSATRILDEDGDTIQISDNDGNLAAMMTLKETWGDYKNGSEVESSVVYVYAGEYRWGYVDADCDAVKDASDTLVSSVAQLDGEGNIINVTSYKEDGVTISSVTEFNWPAEDYSATRILDEDGDTIQISDNDGNLAAMMTLKDTWGDYKNGSEVESSVVYVYAGEYRWGYVDADCDAVKDASDTLVSSVAQLDGEGNIINVTSYKEDGVTISSVTEFNWPAEDYSATRILDEDGDTIQISDNDGNLAAMMTLKETWGDYKNGSEVESSVVYVYAGEYRWGYVDADCDAVKDASDTLVSSVAQLDGEGNIINVTSYKEDGVTISSVTEFNWPAEDYSATRILDEDGDTIQISDNDGNLAAMMTLKETWGDYKNGSEVESSVVYVYAGEYRWGYVDADCDAVKDASDTLVSSVAQLDGEGNIINVTSYKEDGVTISSVTEFNWPAEDYSATRILDEDGDTIQISDNDGNLAAMMTLKETWGDYKNGSEVESSVVYVYAGEYRWGYVDADCDAVKDASDTLVSSVAQLDGEGNIINVTSYKEDGTTISSVTEFNWPAEDYSATRILDEDGDTIQISDNDGNLAAMMTLKETWGDYKNGSEVESSVVYVYAGEYRWGYVDADCDAVKDASDTLVSSVAQLDGEGNIINVTSYKEDGVTISSVTEFNWPAEDYSATRILDEDGDTIQISDNDGNLAAMMTLKETWGDYKNGSEVESSVVYVYAGEYRWGYVDADCDAVKDASDTLVSSVAQLDGEGNIINVTSYKEDGVTISSVTEFNWPAEDYSATRILDEDGDTIQISDNDGNLAAMMTLKETWGDYKNGSEVESSVVYVYAGDYRWGYVDADCDAVKDTSDTLVSSVAQLDGEGNIINVTSYKEDGVTISSVTEFNWPAEDYSATRILDEDGDTIQISDNDGNLAAMMTLKDTWGDYKNGSEVESSVVYVYAGDYRWGYVDADCDAVKDASDTLVSSVAQLDGEGNIINVTSYKEDGVTISSVTEFNWPAEDYSATRILDEDGDTIQISDNDGNLAAMMTLKETWGDYKNGSEVESSVVYVYAGEYRWGYVDADCDAVKDASDTLVSSVAQLDGEGNIINVTSYKEDGTTISSVTEFNWPAEDYSATRILDEDGDTIQISDNDGNLAAMMTLKETWGDYKNGSEVESSVVYVYAGDYRWGYVDADCDAVKDASDTLVSSVAQLDGEGNIINVTSYKEDGVTISSVTEFNWPAEDYSATRILDEDGDTIQISDNDGNLAAMMTLKETWGDYKNGSEVESSVVYVYAGEYRWGYVDADCDAVKDASDTLVSSVAQLDGEGNIINVTSYKEDGITISSVTEFNWPAEDYSATRILDDDGDMIQISDNDGNLAAMMTLKEKWGDYKNGSDVASSVVYVYAGEYRWGYVDADCDAVKDASDTLVSSVAQLDGEGNIINVTSYKEDGITISSVTEFNWPAEDYSATRILDDDGDMIQISDNDGNLAAMMTLKEKWGDYKNGSEVASSVVYVYAGEYRWGYVDADCDAVKDASDTLVSSVAQLDGEGNIINVTSYKEDGITISSVTEFNWPAEDYSATRILDDDGDMIQISDNDGNLAAMMTLKEKWGDYKNGSEVASSVVYVYAGEYRWGYVDADCDAVKDASDTLVSSVAQLDGEGNIINMTSYKEDGITISSVTEFNWPAEDYSATRILDDDGDMIQISDNDGNLAAMMTLKEKWGDYKNGSEVASSVVYVYAGEYRWGYVDADCDAVKDASDTLVSSVAQLDGEGNIINVTSYKEDGITISSVTEFNWPAEDYSATRILDDDGDMIQISDNDGNLAAMMTLKEKWGDYKNGSEVESSVVYVYAGNYRWGYVDADCDAVKDASDTLVSSVAQLDGEGNIINVTSYKEDGITISSVTEFNWPAEDYSATRILDDDGDMIQISDNDGNLAAMMTLKEKWGDYKNGSEVASSVVYVYAGEYRWGYVDADCDAVKDASDTLVSSVAQLDGEGNIINMTSYKEDGITISSVTEFNWPAEDYTATRILDDDGDMIQISDNDGNLAAMMTLKEKWGDYKSGSEVASSVVYVYAGEYRWGYVDADCDAVKDASDTLVSSVAQLDGEGNIINMTSYKEDGITISSVTEFNWPAEDYTATRILDEDGDTIQISDNDGNLSAMMTLNKMWGNYKNGGSDIDTSTVYVYAGSYRWGYYDTNKNAVKDATDTLVASVAEFDNDGNIINITSYKEDGATISSVTEFNWPAEDNSATRILDVDGDTIQISDNDGNLAVMMTLNKMWGNYKNGGSDIESSTIYVYDGSYRWGYYDTNKNAVKDATDTLVASVAEFDNDGNYISITSYKTDGATISSVTEFDWPIEDYTVTRLVNEPAGKSTIQISDNEGQLCCMMTMATQWADYRTPSLVDESILYEYNEIGDNTQRVGYVDENGNALKDSGEIKLDSIMIYDNEGSIVSITGYLFDGATMQYIATYDVPMEDWNTQKMINSPFTRDTITIFDNEGRVRATQTTEGTIADPESDYDVIDESTVYVYEDTVRWGYTDTAKDGLYDSDNDTILENKVQYDTNGNVLSATYFSYDEATMTTAISRVDVYNDEFGTPHEGYVTTYLYNYPGDDDMVKQLSDPDGNLVMKHEYDNDSDAWTYLVYRYPVDAERYGYIDKDCDGGYSAGDQLESYAVFDENGNLSSVTEYFRSGTYQGNISKITTYYTNGYMSIRYNEPSTGDYTIYNYNRDGQVYRIDYYDVSEDTCTEDYYNESGYKYRTRVRLISDPSVIISDDYDGIQELPDGRTRVVDPVTGLVSVYNVDKSLGETTTAQKVVTIFYEDNEGNSVQEDNLGYMTVWDGNRNDPGASYTTYYNQLNSVTTYVFVYPLGRGSNWEMREMEYWADGLVIERDYETQNILSISKYERDGSNNLVNETIIYQNKLKTVTEMNWPVTGWRAVYIAGLGEDDNDAVFIVDDYNVLRGYMEIKKNSNINKYKDPANIVLSVVYDYDNDGNRIGYVDTDKDGIWDEGVETTIYSYTEEWSQDSTKEVTRIYNASGDTIIISDATFNGKKRAKMVLTGTGIAYDVPANVSTSELYLYENDGSWNIYNDVNKNGEYDAGTDTDTGYDGEPNYRSSNGALVQTLDNEGNIISNTFGNGYMIDYHYDNDGNYLGSREAKYYGTYFNYDNEGNPYPTDIQDYVGNWIQVDPTNGSYQKYYKEFETSGASEGEYVGTVNVYEGGYLISSIDNEGGIIDKTYTNSNIKFRLMSNGDAVNIYAAGSETLIAAQILQYGEYREYHSNGMASSILKYTSADGTFVKRYNSSGNLTSLTYTDGSFYGADANGTYLQFSEMPPVGTDPATPYFHINCNDGNQYIFRTQEVSYIVQNATTSAVVSITDNGTTPTDTISYSTVYKWTEDGGSTTVYRFNGINRYFSGGVLQKTKWTDGSYNLVREIVYDSINPDGTVVIASITDGSGASMTINRSGSTVTSFDFTTSDGADIDMASNGQVTKITRDGHIQNYSTSGMITSITTGDGVVQTRDASGNVTSITESDGTTMTYNRYNGNLTSVVINDASLGQTRLYELFSGHIRLSSVTENSGRLTEYYYDTNGYLKEYNDAAPEYAIIVTEDDVTYRYGYHSTSAIPGSYLYNVTKLGVYQLTYERLQTAPYYVLSQQLQIYGPEIAGTHHDLYLVFFGSSWKTGGNYEYGILNYITGTRWGVEYSEKNP